MRTTGAIVAVSLAAVFAAWLVVTGWRQPRPSLAKSVERLRRSPSPVDHLQAEPSALHAIGTLALKSSFVQRHVAAASALRIVGRPPVLHAGYLVAAAVAGALVPPLIVALLAVGGIVSLGIFVPVGVSVVAAMLAPLLLHVTTTAAADEIRTDLRHQLSSYLDVMTMLLAGNSGHEGALEQAAAAGDGLLFRELRRRMREVATTGESMVGALTLVARDLEIDELEQVATAAALSAAEGSPVARTLAAKCSTLRSTLAADDEAKARVRNDKVTPPLVAMALLFMALIIYPALNLG